MAQQPESGNLLGDMEMEPLPAYGPLSRRQSNIPRKPVASNVSVHALSSQEDASKQTGGSVSGFSRDVPDGQHHGGDPWLPGIWRQFPYRGTFAILGCMSLIIASIVVLVVSDGQPTEDWRLSPTVYLAFFMTGTNMLARFAFHDGVKIAWWYKALQGGTVRDLHVQWSHADGFFTALFSGRDFGMVTLASIAVTIMVIDQPLIQRASSVVSVPRMSPVQITASIAPEIPWGFTGFESGRGDEAQIMTQPMITAFNAFNGGAPISSGFSGCTDTCTGWIEAGGLAANCNSTTGPIIYESNIETGGGVNLSPFSATFGLLGQTGPPLNLSSQMVVNIAYTNNSGYAGRCSGIRTERTCYLAPATIRYPVKLTGSTLEINGEILSAGQVQSFSPPPITGFIDGGGDYDYWTLGGMFVAANSLFASNATYHINDAVQYVTLPDTLSSQFLVLPNQNNTIVNGSLYLNTPIVCNTSWSDPTSYILSSLNNIALRASLVAAVYPYRNTSAPPEPQVVTMLQTSNITVFKSEYRSTLR